MENDKIIPSESASNQNSTQLIAPGTPIQFDIVLPAMEFLDQNRGGRYGQRQWLITLTEWFQGRKLDIAACVCWPESVITAFILTS